MILSAAGGAGELFKDDEFDQMKERVGKFRRDLAKHFSTRNMVANKPDVAPVADVPGIICNFCHVKFVPDRVEIGENAWCPHCGTVMYQSQPGAWQDSRPQGLEGCTRRGVHQLGQFEL